MERLTAKDFSPELLDVFDQYVHGDIDRRGFFDRAAKYVAAPMTAAMVLDMLNPKFAEAQQVPKDDKRIKTEWVEIDSPKGYGKIKAYVAKPANATGKLPTVLVVHENRGLNPHIEDIARRLALANFLAVAPDALTPLGGYPSEGEDKARELFPKLDQAKTREDFLAATTYARTRPDSTGKIGAVGFCYGGGMVNFLATRVPELLAGVPFYGGAPAVEDVKNIKAAMLIQHGGNDKRLVEGWPAFDAAMTAANVKHEGFIYPNAEHGFNNDTTPRYDAAAAKLAWDRTIAHFNKYLR
ncbi:MAG TPA: dienelactone hydrolase family protein [Vicinamibacterales bacterium]|nr:dienelactone hydrolase family protein [Vicinamibacterales bacterium]